MAWFQVVWAFQEGKAGWSEDFWISAANVQDAGDIAAGLARPRANLMGTGARRDNPPVQLKYQRAMDPVNPSLTDFKQLDMVSEGMPWGQGNDPDMPWTRIDVRLDGGAGFRRVWQVGGVPDVTTQQPWSDNFLLTGGGNLGIQDFFTRMIGAGVGIRYRDRTVEQKEIVSITTDPTSGNVVLSTGTVPHGLIPYQKITLVRCKTRPTLKGTWSVNVIDAFTFSLSRTNIRQIFKDGWCRFRPVAYGYDKVIAFEVEGKAKHKAGRPLYSLVGRQSRR
jgi:hypothetical protein